MTAMNSNIFQLALDKDVKAYIYQQFVDFEPFVTPETFISVQLKDPMKLLPQFESEDIKEMTPDKLKKMVRVVISLTEDGASVECEGLSDDIYEAINFAKDGVLQKLVSIQDQIISNQERAAQVITARASGNLH